MNTAILQRRPARTRYAQPHLMAKRFSQRTQHPMSGAPSKELQAWLEQHLFAQTVAELEALSAEDFLRQTTHSSLSTAARLRLLAIFIEPIAAAGVQPRGWAVLARLYSRAASAAPHNVWVLHARALAAMHIADRRRPDAVQAQLLDDAQQALEQALFIRPGEAELCNAMGKLCYERDDPQTALAWYERALAADPALPWAALYRAHCLHDLQRWDEAVDAYDAVPADAFIGAVSWRMALLVEQRGYCRLRAGDRAGATADIAAVLTQYERSEGLAQLAMSRHLVHTVRRLDPALQQRAVAVAERLHWAWALDALATGSPSAE